MEYTNFLDSKWSEYHILVPRAHLGHNCSKHWVDDHNNHRHDPIDLAETWQPKWWMNWQYSFFLALSEVNANTCRRKLALKMINKNLEDDENNMPVGEAPKSQKS